jgi:hypothetical protein
LIGRPAAQQRMTQDALLAFDHQQHHFVAYGRPQRS